MRALFLGCAGGLLGKRLLSELLGLLGTTTRAVSVLVIVAVAAGRSMLHWKLACDRVVRSQGEDIGGVGDAAGGEETTKASGFCCLKSDIPSCRVISRSALVSRTSTPFFRLGRARQFLSSASWGALQLTHCIGAVHSL